MINEIISAYCKGEMQQGKMEKIARQNIENLLRISIKNVAYLMYT